MRPLAQVGACGSCRACYDLEQVSASPHLDPSPRSAEEREREREGEREREKERWSERERERATERERERDRERERCSERDDRECANNIVSHMFRIHTPGVIALMLSL